MHLNNNKLKQAIFLAALFILGAFLFWLLKGFVSPFLGAVVFYVLLRRPFFYLTEKPKRKWNKTLATAVLMFLSFMVLILPLLLLTLMLTEKVTYLVGHYQEILIRVQQWAQDAGGTLGITLLSTESVNKVAGLAAEGIPGFLTATADVVADIFVLYLILYFMLANARLFEAKVREMLPFRKENDNLLLTELKTQTFSNAIGVPLLAVLQALAAWLGYWLLGVEQPFFWAVITGIMSVLPVVGTTIVWLPLAAFMFLNGFRWQGSLLGLYGILIIGNIDNVFRFVLQRRLGDVHPLITFFGVIIGLNLFGFVGLIFGPLLISYFILLLKIYRNEYLGVSH